MPKIRETIESWFCLLVNTPLSMPVLYNEVKEGRNQVVSSCLYRRRSRLSDRSKQTVKGVWALWKLASKTVSAFLNSPELSQWEWGRVRGLAYPNHIFQWLLYIVLQAYINCNSLALHRPLCGISSEANWAQRGQGPGRMPMGYSTSQKIKKYRARTWHLVGSHSL